MGTFIAQKLWEDERSQKEISLYFAGSMCIKTPLPFIQRHSCRKYTSANCDVNERLLLLHNHPPNKLDFNILDRYRLTRAIPLPGA